MSSIGFMTIDGEARVSGRERNPALYDELAEQQLREHCNLDEARGPSILRYAIDYPHDVRSSVLEDGWQTFPRRFLLHARWNWPVKLPDRPAPADNALMSVNLGSILDDCTDPVTALAVRFYAQCEANAWIDGPDRDLVADLIDAGRERGIFRDEPSINGHYDGWPGVTAMLRADRHTTVVLDYSVTDGFPDAAWAAAPAHVGPRFRDWYNDLPTRRRWAASEAGMRRWTRLRVPALRINPHRWQDIGIADGLTWRKFAAAWHTAGTYRHLRRPQTAGQDITP